jgi:two-component system chemotaxis response regulator CheY
VSGAGGILIVDDSRAMRAYLRNILKGFGPLLLEAGSGAEALAALRTTPAVDLFVVDWNLPGMDGVALVREIRRIPAYAASRILMVTTEVEPAQIREALEAGVQEYLMKPFTPEMMLEKLLLLGWELPQGR